MNQSNRRTDSLVHRNRIPFAGKTICKSSLLLLGLLLLLATTSFARAQSDTVITRGKSGKTAKRRGEIVDWKGTSLSLKSGSRTREIDNNRIVRIETPWHEDFGKAKRLLSVGQVEEAISRFRNSLSNENRVWAQNIIRAELVRSHLASEQPGLAIREFMRIIATDPQTRFASYAPLPWSSSLARGEVNDLTRQLLDSREPMLQLIGAGWQLSGDGRAKAVKILEQLTGDFEPTIAYLATAQLWRSEVGSVTEEKLQAWKIRVDQMPEELRAGPYYVLATSQSQLGQNTRAALNWMRIPILYPEQIEMAAASLYKCGRLMQNDGRLEESKTLWAELKSKYPNSSWAKQVE